MATLREAARLPAWKHPLRFFFPRHAMRRQAVRNGIAFIKIKSSFFARIVKSH